MEEESFLVDCFKMGVTQWIIITILLAFIGLLLQVAGYVAPMWIWLETDSFLVGVGLWFTTGCGLSGTCGENTTTPEVSFIYATGEYALCLRCVCVL